MNEMLRGRALIERGDESPAAELAMAQADFQKAAQLFRSLVTTGTNPRSVLQARVQWARAEQRLHHPDKVIESLNPVAEAIRKGEEGSGDYAEALPMLGEALLELGQVGESEGVLTQAISGLPATSDRRPALLVKLAEVRAAQAHWPEMFQTLDELALADKDGSLMAQSAYANADRAIAKKEWDTAQKLLDRIVALGDASPHYVSALSDLGTVHAEQGQHALAAESYRKLLSSTTADSTVLSTAAFNLGLCLEKDAGQDPVKLAAAAEALSQGAQRFKIPTEKTNPDAAEQKAAVQASKCARRAAGIYTQLKRMDEADKSFQLCYDQFEKLAPADREREQPDALLYAWAGSQLNSGQVVRADELFAKLFQDFPTSPYADDARLSVAQGHDQAGRSDEARQLYQTLGVDPAAAEAIRQDALRSWMNLEARVENWPESQRIAELITNTFGDSPVAFDARFRRGEAQVQRGEFANALQTLNALRDDSALPPSTAWKPQLELLWAESQVGLKEYDVVRTALTKFLADQPAPLLADQAHEILGRTEFQDAHFDEARVHFEHVTNSLASQKSVLAAKAQLAIAESHLFQKKYEKAILAYHIVYTAYKLPEFQAPALLQIAKCDLELNDRVSAKSNLDVLIEEFPESQWVPEARKLLEAVQRKLPATDVP